MPPILREPAGNDEGAVVLEWGAAREGVQVRGDGGGEVVGGFARMGARQTSLSRVISYSRPSQLVASVMPSV